MKIYPEIILKAMSNNKPVGGVKLWILAKHYDNGNGFIPARDFKHYLKRTLGIPRGRYDRWIRQAERLGLISYENGVYRLISLSKAAAIIGVTHLAQPLEIGVRRFVNAGWAAWVWAAYIKHHEGKPISRKTLKALTGIPERTQRDYERIAGVKNKGNYANLGNPAKDPQNAIAIDRERGIYGKAGQTRQRLPNSRTIPEEIKKAKKGRTSKANRELNALLNKPSSSNQQSCERLYFTDYGKLKKANRASRKANQDHNTRPDNRYLYLKTLKGVAIWEGVPC